MGSACVQQGGASVDNAKPPIADIYDQTQKVQELPTVGIGILGNPTLPTPPQSPSNSSAVLKKDNPPPPPPGCPQWQKLNKKQRYNLTRNEPLMAIQSLDEYWLRKIDKYVVKGKLPPLNSGTKGDAAWKLMLATQARSVSDTFLKHICFFIGVLLTFFFLSVPQQQRRVMIWQEFMQQNFSDIVKKEEEEEIVLSGNGETKEALPSTKADEKRMPGGMAAMKQTQDNANTSVGVTGKMSSSVTEKNSVSIEKRQVAALGMLSETIRRMRRINSLLRDSIAVKPEDEGRQVLYKRSLDHLLELEMIVEPFRRAKMKVDNMMKSLSTIQINAHEQQMKQWLDQEEKEKWTEDGAEDGSETTGLLSGQESSSSMNPALSQ